MGEVMKNHNLVYGVVVTAMLLASCGRGVSTLPTSAKVKVTGSVQEWKIDVNSKSIASPDVLFSISNKGTMKHEFVVVKTVFADGKIPVTGDHFKEDQVGVDFVDEISQFAAGTTAELSTTLSAGTYQLVCNLPGHYQAGMHTAFTVTT